MPTVTVLTAARMLEIEGRPSALGSIPVVAGIASGLSSSLTPVPGSWWRLDPANWPEPYAEKTLQYRLHFMAMDCTPDDTIGALLYSTTDAANLIVESFKDASSDGMVEVVSGWQTFPTTPKGGYLVVRNSDGARGTAVCSFIEVALV